MKIKEIIKLLPKGIENADKIVEGMINRVKSSKGWLSQDKVEEIVKRRILCDNCEYNSINYPDGREDFHCTLCGCGIETKTHCLKCTCGAADWNDEHPNDIKPVKWLPYEEELKESDNFHTEGNF